MKKILSLALAIVLILQAFSLSVHAVYIDYTLDNKVGYYPNRVSVSINQEYTLNLHVFTEEDFPGIDIEKIEQKPTGLIRNEDGTIGVDPAFDINESDIEYVRANLIVHLKNTDNENIGQKMNELLSFPFVDSAKRIYIYEQEDGHEHMPSKLIHSMNILCLDKDYAVSEWFTYCLLCGKETGREKSIDYSPFDFSTIIIDTKNPNVNKKTEFTAEDFPGIDLKGIHNGYGLVMLYLNTDSREEGLDAINKVRQLDFVERAYFSFFVQAASASGWGDVNFDNRLDVADARETLRRSIGLSANCFNNNADMDMDGRVTVADARIILRAAIGLDYIPSVE